MAERKNGPGRFVLAARRLGVAVALTEHAQSTRCLLYTSDAADE